MPPGGEPPSAPLTAREAELRREGLHIVITRSTSGCSSFPSL